MPKVKWGGGLTANDIDEVDTSRQFQVYDGPPPPRGVYGFRITLKKTKSSNDNDQVQVRLRLDPRGRPEHKEFNGFFMMDWIPVMSSTSFRVRALTDALGVTGKDFVTRTIVDEDGNITKIGDVKISDNLIRANIAKDPNSTEGYYRVLGYLPAVEEPDAEDDVDDADDADDPDLSEEPPF